MPLERRRGVRPLADRADLFVLYDDLPFDRRSWRQRNRIKTPQGTAWLSIPIAHRHASDAPPPTILDAVVAAGHPWRRQHWEAIRHCYTATPFFDEHAPFFEELYAHEWTRLGELTLRVIDYIVDRLGIRSRVVRSSEIGLERAFRARGFRADRRTERIAFLVRELGGRAFLEGAAGRNYIDEALLATQHVGVVYQDYRHPTYPQRFGAFVPYLSTIDLLFNCGPESLAVIRSGRTTDA